MIKNIVNKDSLKVVGEVGYRIGKDIVREGTKAVIGKAAGAAIAVTLKEGFGGIKNMELNTVLGDITRMEKKQAKKLKRAEKKMQKKEELLKKASTEDVQEAINDALIKVASGEKESEGK